MTAGLLVGSPTPRLWTPEARPLTPETSRGFEAIDFADDVLGMPLMPWQKWALIHGLELTESGAFRFRTLLIMCARQQGKTTLMQVLALWRMYVDQAPLVIGSAQNLDMAEETWDGAVSMAEGTPDLAAEIEKTNRVNGNKFIRLTSGSRYKVTTATRRGGRGLSSDLVLLDELREHQSWEAWSAITKTTMARPSPQVLGFSNAGDRTSVVLASLRTKALDSRNSPTTTLGIFEWSAPDGAAVDDESAWVAANPALGHRSAREGVEAALETDPEDVFRTEVLCQWVESTTPAAINLDIWHSLADSTAARGAYPVFGVASGRDGDEDWAAVAVAWMRPDGLPQIMLADYRPGVAWLDDRVAGLLRDWGGGVLADPSVKGLLPSADPEVMKGTAAAHNAFSAAVEGSQLRWGSTEALLDRSAALTTAVRASTWKPSGDSRVYDRRGSKDISPLLAAALALHALAGAPVYDVLDSIA